MRSLISLARRNKGGGYHDAARSAMRQAQQTWTPGLGIARPDFSAREWRELDVDQVEKLVALARRNKDEGYHDAARSAMRQAQQTWTPGLGIARPDFSAREWRELDVDQVEKLVALARRNKDEGYHDAARSAMRQAQQTWTPGLGIARPDFSAREWRELDVDQVEKLVALARRNKDEGYHDAARSAMRQAQQTWTPGLGIAEPDFSAREWRELDIDQVEKLVAIAQQNSINGWESGEMAAIHAAHEIWQRLHDPRPSEPFVTPRDRRCVRITWQPSHLSQSTTTTLFDCPICLEAVHKGQLCSTHDACRRRFCTDCMQKWAEMSMTCPMCRKAL